MATKESENFYRLVSLLVDIGTATIRRLFLKYAVTPPTVTSVTQFLVQEQNTLTRLATKRILGPAQQALLQPPPGQLVDPEIWDISLLCVLLKNICPITQGERNEIDTVRNVRNQIYGHRASSRIPDADFSNHWGVVETAIKNIAHLCNDVAFENHVAKYINSVKTGPLDIESVMQVFKQWCKDEDVVQSKLNAIGATLDDVSDVVKDLVSKPKVTDHIFENIKEQTRILLEYNSKRPFVFTKQFNEAKSILQREGSIIISGNPGEGKTLTAYKLVESIGSFDRCVRLFNPTHWDHTDTREVDIIVLDDVFGKHQLDVGCLDRWLPVLKDLEAYVSGGRLKVILTTRQNVFSEAKKRLDELSVIINNVIELTSSNLTEDEKMELLRALLAFYNKDESKINIRKCCSAYKANIGFPYCCFLYTADNRLFDLRENFFERPLHFFRETLGSLSSEIKASLFFLFYMKGQCSVKDLKPVTRNKRSDTEELLVRISDLIGITYQMSLTQVRETLEVLSGIYVSQLGKTFNFAHDTVYECVALILGERYPEEVVDNCTWDFLTGCVITVPSEAETKLLIDKDVYESLCLRFIQETLSDKKSVGKFYDLRLHRTMQTRDVCVDLFRTLHKQDKLREFVTREMDEGQGGFLYRYLTSKEKDERAYLVEEAVPYLECNCEVEAINKCWKCYVRNDALRGACFGGDPLSYSVLLEVGVSVNSTNIVDACKGKNSELLQLVISTVKSLGKFIPEEVPISKALVISKQTDIDLYEILRAYGAIAMPLCVYDAVATESLDLVQYFVKELKDNGKWDVNDFWLQHALQLSISFDNTAICNFLNEEGLGYHRGCLLEAVRSKQLSKVKETVAGMKIAGTWHSSDWSFEREFQNLSNMLRTGEVKALNIPTLADVGISEAFIEAKNYEDKTIYKYLQTEGVQLTMETLPYVVATRQLDLVKEVVDELKERGQWNPVAHCGAKSILRAIRLESCDIFDFLVSEGLSCTMDMLPEIVTDQNITVEDVNEIANHIKKFGNWNPHCVPMQSSLVEAFKRDDKSIFEYLILNGAIINSMSVVTAAFAQDIETVSMCLQILKCSSEWDPSDQLLNLCMQVTRTTSPEIYALLLGAGVGYSTKSLLAAAMQNDSVATMMTINQLIDSNNWKPETDSNVTRSLELMCQHNNMMMFNILQKKGAKLTLLGIFNIIKNCNALFYNTGPENRKKVEGVPSLTAIVASSLGGNCLVAAIHQQAIAVYVRLIHALEETGKLDKNEPLLQDALEAAIESGSVVAFNILSETSARVTESIVLKMLQSIKDGFKIEFPERLINRTFRLCMMQCLLSCICKGNIEVLEEVALLMKQNTLWCPDDQRILQAIQTMEFSKPQVVTEKLALLKLISTKQ